MQIALTSFLAAAKQPSILDMAFPFLLMGVMFWVIIIRPQQKQRKELAKKVAAVTPGDKAISAGGIHGLVHKVKDKTMIIKVAEGTMLEFEKSSIITIIPKNDAAKSGDDK